MFTLPNILTFLRFPLSLAFLQDDPYLRLAAIILAMLTDCLDGYFARRYKAISRLGTFMDPFADKFFVFTALAVLISEQRLLPWEALSMLCRDFSVFIFGCYLAWKGVLAQYQFRAIWCGKVTTAMQLFVLCALTMQIAIPPFLYFSFIAIGLLALGELYLERAKLRIEG